MPLLSKPAIEWKRAGAEFLIIAAGVFAGLAADQWQESRRDRAAEREYLHGLAADLRRDSAEYEIALASNQSVDAAAKEMLALDSAGLHIFGNPLELPIAVMQAGWTYFPTVANYTFDELMNTGEFRVLRNRELKNLLAHYYSQVESSRQWDDDLRRAARAYEAQTANVLSPEVRILIESNCCDPRVPRVTSFLTNLEIRPVLQRVTALNLDSSLSEIRYRLARQRWLLTDLSASARAALRAVTTELARLES